MLLGYSIEVLSHGILCSLRFSEANLTNLSFTLGFSVDYLMIDAWLLLMLLVLEIYYMWFLLLLSAYSGVGCVSIRPQCLLL